MSNRFDIAVIGGGITGFTAASHAAQNGASVIHLRGADFPGGLVRNLGRVEGFPTGAGEVSGGDLALGLSEANRALGVAEVAEDATDLTQGPRGFVVSAGDERYRVRQVIAATGARLKQLDVPGAEALVGKGVSQCAWCDGALSRGRDVVVVGGGDAALEEALHLAPLASTVTIVTRGERLKARQSYVSRLADCPNVRFRWAQDVTGILGEEGVEAIRLKDRETGTVEDLPCYGVFVFIGQTPDTGLFTDLAETDAEGRLVTDASLQTRTPGLFAAGAARAGYGGRLVHAVGEAATAAIHAAEACDT